jgi:hypothetical protein
VTGGIRPDSGADGIRRIDNGLVAPTYVPLTDVEPDLGRQLLDMLGRARIAAYLAPPPAASDGRQRLFVAAEERADARTIVAAAVRGAEDVAASRSQDDPLAGVDTDAAFSELIADWHVDTVRAIRDAERDLRREDADWRERLVRPAAGPDWLDEDHYVPPPPPPLPRLSAPTIGAMLLMAASVFLLIAGGALGLDTQISMLLGVAGVLTGGWILFSRLHDRPEDDDDDGAVI